MLTETDAWFRKWSPSGSPPQALPGPAGPASPPPSPSDPQFQPAEKKARNCGRRSGHSMESLFAAYMRGASAVTIDDPFIVKQYQAANLLRFCELLVRLGTVRTIKLVTKNLSDDSRGRLEPSNVASRGITSSSRMVFPTRCTTARSSRTPVGRSAWDVDWISISVRNTGTR